MTIKQIQNTIAELIKKETFAAVEFTYRNDDNWTISADEMADLNAAVEFMVKNLGWKIEEIDYDEECECGFAYMVAA